MDHHATAAMRRLTATVAIIFPQLALADLTVQLPEVSISEGTPSVTLPVSVIGSDQVTDMNVIVQIADGGPQAGAADAPRVSAVDYTDSIWSTAAGGFVSFFASSPPSSEIVDPSLSLLQNGESVAASGDLMELTVDTASFPIGLYPVIMQDTIAGDSELLNTGSQVPTTFIDGSVSILRALDHWRIVHFGAEIENPLLEPLRWGNDADPDLDGLNNLIEFAFGTDPNQPGRPSASNLVPGLPSSSVVTVGEDQFLELTYSRRTLATGLTIVVSSSDDQVAWQSPAPDLVQIGSRTPIGDGLYEFVRIRLPISAGTRLFARLNVSHAP